MSGERLSSVACRFATSRTTINQMLKTFSLASLDDDGPVGPVVRFSESLGWEG